MTLEPNGFIGAAMGIQGITDATVVLHGQNGCRKGLMISQKLLVRSEPRDNGSYAGGSAIPYSDVRPEDYYTDTAKKLSDTLQHVNGEGYGLIAVMCSPGVSIVGDDLERLAGSGERIMTLDSDSLPPDAYGGFDRCMSDVMRFLSPTGGTKRPESVNILGLSIMHKDWSSFRHELSHLLKDAGFDVACTLGAGCTVSDIERSVNSSFNIVVDPGCTRETAALYEKNYGMPSISIGRCPIGFDATEELMRRIEVVTGKPLAHGLSMLKKSKRRGYDGIVASGKDLTGSTFSIVAPESTSIPLRDWLTDSFGMVECGDRPDFLFAPGDMARLEEASGGCGKGVDIGSPSSCGSDFLKKPLMGLEGAMYLLDALFNRVKDNCYN